MTKLTVCKLCLASIRAVSTSYWARVTFEVWYKYDMGFKKNNKKKTASYVSMHVYSLKDCDLDSNARILFLNDNFAMSI